MGAELRWALARAAGVSIAAVVSAGAAALACSADHSTGAGSDAASDGGLRDGPEADAPLPDGGSRDGSVDGSGDGANPDAGPVSCVTPAACGATLGCVSGLCAPCKAAGDCAKGETCEAGKCSPTCTLTLQSIADDSADAGVVSVPACVYRELVTIHHAVTLWARPGAEIRGSDLWSSWTKSGALWTQGTVPPLSQGSVSYSPICAADATAKTDGGVSCMSPEQVFFDGKPLVQVDGNPESGQFALDAKRNVLLADDPTGHQVEVTTRPNWLVVQNVDDITLDGFTMRNAGNAMQTGGLDVSGGDNFTIRNSLLTEAHGSDLSINGGKGHQVLSSELSFGGQEGYHLYDVNQTLLQRNKIHDNNTAGFSMSFEAGGGKASASTNVTLNANRSYDNSGFGLWSDVYCASFTYSNNDVYGNAPGGILFEISNGAKILGNRLWENGWVVASNTYPNTINGVALYSSSSSNAEIYQNIVAWNAAGIVINSEVARSDGGVIGNDVHDNTVAVSPQPALCSDPVGLAFVQDGDSGQMFLPESGNTGRNDDFWLSVSEPLDSVFFYKIPFTTLAAFAESPGDKGGAYIDKATLQAILTDAGMPTTPIPRATKCSPL